MTVATAGVAAGVATPTTESRLERVVDGVYRFRDTCWVYVLKDGGSAVLVDFGNGDVLEELAAIGVERVSDVLMTHHHRDQGQGLPRAAAAGVRVWVPASEQELFRGIDVHWQARELDNSYNNRQDRFSLLESVQIAGTLDDYREYRFGNLALTVIPTPGHTTGSLTLLGEHGGKRLAFTGDLIAGPGKLWSLAATQWSYNGAEGVAATLASLLDLRDREPEYLLPSHGEAMNEPSAAIDLLSERLWELLRQRGQNKRLFELRERPFEELSPHLLYNRTAMAYHYVLLSDSGAALFIDFGYDFMTGQAAGNDRASRRPWLYTLDKLKRQFGVESVEVVVPTHFHDDHVAGIELLRRVEGAEVWAASTFADVLSNPWRYDLPCLWYDPVPLDRVLPLEVPIRWREFELTLHHQPGHTSHAVAISFEADGQKVLAVGDQYEGGADARWNYVYNNGFSPEDYRVGADLLERVQPDLLLAGHYPPHRVDGEFVRSVRSGADMLYNLHRELLPVEDLDFGGGDRAVKLHPYRATVAAGGRISLTAQLTNPLPGSEVASVTLMLPQGWRAEPERHQVLLEPGESASVEFSVIPSGPGLRRARVAADLTVGNIRLGQQAEALVTLERSKEQTVARPEERERVAGERSAPFTNTVSFIGANFVAQQVGYQMTGGWGQGDRAASEYFRPAETFAERFEELLAAVRRLGFSAMDIWTSHISPTWAGEEHLSAACDLLNKHGVSVPSLAGWFGSTAEEFEASCKIASRLGVPVLAGSTSLLEQDRSLVVALLQRYSLRLGLENHPEKNPEELRRRIADGGEGTIGAAVDTGWFATQGYDAVSALSELEEHLFHVHLKDIRAAGAHETCRYGEGIVPVEECVMALRRLSYRGPISVEHEPESFDPSEDCRASRVMLEAWLAAPS